MTGLDIGHTVYINSHVVSYINIKNIYFQRLAFFNKNKQIVYSDGIVTQMWSNA